MVRALAGACVCLLMAGCAGFDQSTANPRALSTPGSGYVGMVHGGQQPVSGASIQIWVINSGLDGQPATPLLQTPAKTDANGNFLVDPTSYTCPSYGALTYMTATGGNPGIPGLTSNRNLALMAMTDSCSPLSQKYISINEVTTAASVFFFGQFFSSFPSVGFYTTNSAAPYDFLQNYEAIVSLQSGVFPGTKYAAGDTFPVQKLYTMANIISPCINSTGGTAGDNTACGQLFSLTTPPGGTAPTNPVDALVNLYRNPTLNVGQIFSLTTPAAPFAPALSLAPADWYLRYNTTGLVATPKYRLCTTWGDSLTQGGEDGSSVTIAKELSYLPSCYAGNNQGVGGQTSTQIGIREGGVQTTATIAGGTIPTAGPVAVSFPAGQQPVGQTGPGVLPVQISGVQGQLSIDQTSGNAQFVRTVPGAAVASPANAAMTVNVGNYNSGFVTIWAGRNNPNQGQVLSDVAAMVAALPTPKHFVVLSLTDSVDSYEWRGATGYNVIANINALLKAAYPANYLDIRSAIEAAYDPTNPEDVIDHGHDVPPSSLRAVDAFGSLHAALDASTCTFTVDGNAPPYYTLTVGQEKIWIYRSDDQNVTQCIRGYAGTQAVAHAQGTTFSGVDGLHLNGAADRIIARLIDQYIQAN